MKPYRCYALAAIVSAVILAGTANAQEELKFPTEREEFTEVFRTMPEPGRSSLRNPKGITNSKSVPDAIADDRPRAGALIHFDYDSHTVKADSHTLLKKFGLSLQHDLPNTVFVIEGHADSTGSDEYNLILSQRRADAVKRFLMSECHIDGTRLITSPLGETDPIAPNETEAGRTKNRRVEFVRIR